MVTAVIIFGFYLITSIISFGVGFFILPGLFLFADIQFAIGTVIGVFYFLKRRRQNQSILLYSILVGIIGGIIAAFLIAGYQAIILIVSASLGFLVNVSDFIGYILYGLISGVFIGFLIGVIIAVYYMYREVKDESPQKKEEDEFFKDLIEEE